MTLILRGCSTDELKPILSHYPVTALRCGEEAMQIGDDSFGMFVASEDPFVPLKAVKVRKSVFSLQGDARDLLNACTPQFRLLVGQSWDVTTLFIHLSARKLPTVV